MKFKLFGLALVAGLFCAPNCLAAPVLNVNAEVAQGFSGSGLSVTLAPGRVVSVNFAALGEKIASITAGDRSQFVFSVSGSVVNLKRIKPLNFEGEYSTGGDSTLIVTTASTSGQKVYPITVRFSSSAPPYSVINIAPGESNPIPVQIQEPRRLPLTTTQRPMLSAPQQLAVLPQQQPLQIDVGAKVKTSAPKPTVKPAPVSVVTPSAAAPDPNSYGIPPTPFDASQGKPFEPVQSVATVKLSVPVKAAPKPARIPAISPRTTGHHDDANALVRGLMIAKVPRHSAQSRRVQDAIYLLRLGKPLETAAQRSRVSLDTLQHLIELGSSKNADIAQK